MPQCDIHFFSRTFAHSCVACGSNGTLSLHQGIENDRQAKVLFRLQLFAGLCSQSIALFSNGLIVAANLARRVAILWRYAMRQHKHQMTALLYASVFAVATGGALYFFAHAPVYATLLSAGVLFVVCFIAVEES